jgi:D-alanyl-D-alanine carboxypeptidase
MTTIAKVPVFLLLTAVAWCQSPAAKQAAAIDAIAAQYVKDGKTPGLAVGLMRAGKIVFVKGYGLADVEHSTPVTPNTVFHIQSMTKQLTATGIMLLAERGRLRTDASLAGFFPDFPRASEITIQELLTHTAGLSSYDSKPDFRAFAAESHSIPQLIEWVRSDPFVANPGTAWNYSNTGFLLLAGVIEKASGQRFPVFMQKNVFDRLRLTQTSIEDGKKDSPGAAAGYNRVEGKPGYTPVASHGANGGGGASGLSTVTDMLHWHDALFHGRILTPASFAEMTRPAHLKNGEPALMTTIMPGAPYGYGLILTDYKGHRKIGHTGTGFGFHSIVMTYPDDQLTIVVLTNVNGRPAPIARDIEQAIADVVFQAQPNYPAHWWAPVPEEQRASWEILPQAAKPGEVILSKRNDLGILSNFAATPFTFRGVRYASVEGFWQMMLYPEGPRDARAVSGIAWPHTRPEVAQMTAFEAKDAGTVAEENMRKLGIDWVTFEGKRIPYRSPAKGEHHRLVVAAMRAKLEQNPKVRELLLATGTLILRPDHIAEPDAPPEWRYNEIWMEIRRELQLR